MSNATWKHLLSYPSISGFLNNRQKRTNLLEIGTCLLLLGVFVLAVLPTGSLLMMVFAKIKWLIFLGIIYLAFVRRASLKTQTFPVNVTSLSFLCFIFFASVSCISSEQSFGEGFQRAFSFWCLYLLAFGFAWPTNPRKRIELWTNAVLLICGLIVGVSIYYAVIGKGVIATRMCGVMANANSLGSLAALLTTGCFAKWQTRKNNRFLLLPLAFVGVACILLSGSRTSLAAVMSGIFLISILRKNWAIVFGILIVGSVVLAPAEQVSWRKVGAIGNKEVAVRSFTYKSRMSLMREQFDAWQKKPLLGHGLQKTSRYGEGRLGGECSYLDLLGAVGIVGVVPLFVGLVSGTLSLLHLARESGRKKPKQIAGCPYVTALGVVTVILVNSIGEGFIAAVGAMQPIYVWVILAAASQIPSSFRRISSNT